MFKRIFTIFTVVLLVFLLGCSSLPQTSSSIGHSIVRKAKISDKWEMYQINVGIPAGSEFPVLLKLADGNTVDGYFYLEKGSNIDFHITANSVVYSSQVTSGKLSSDRFSFKAIQTQGNSYTLYFRNDVTNKEAVTVFFEVIYPVGGSMFLPVEIK